MSNIFNQPIAKLKTDPMDVKKAKEKFSSQPVLTSKSISTPETTTVNPFSKEAIIGTMQAVSEVTGGKQLAKAAGILGSLVGTDKKKKEIQQVNDYITKQIDIQISKPEISKQEKTKLLTMKMNLPSPDFTSEALADAPTSKQIIADAGQLALTLTLGLKPGMPAGSSFTLMMPKTAKVFSVMNTLSKTFKEEVALQGLSKNEVLARKTLQFGGRVLKDAALGGAFFGLSEQAQNENATIEQTIDQIKKGGILGGGIIAGAGAFGGVLRLADKLVSPVLKTATNKYVNFLEKAAIVKPKEMGDDAVANILDVIGDKRTFGNRVAEIQLKAIQGIRDFQANWLDRNASFKRIENQWLNAKDGAVLSESEKVYRDAQMKQNWALAQAGKRVSDLNDKLLSYSDIRDEYTAYIADLDFIDRGKLKLGTTPGGRSLEDNMANLNQMVKQIGPEKTKRVQEVEVLMKNFTDDLLAARLESGLIDGEEVMRMKLAHPNYISHDVIKEMDDKIIERFAKDTMNVSKTDLEEAFGSIANIKDPIEALQKHTIIMETVIENNRILTNLVNGAEKYGTSGFRPVRTAENDALKAFINKERKTQVATRDSIAAELKSTMADQKTVVKEIGAEQNKVFTSKYLADSYIKNSSAYEKTIEQAKVLAAEGGNEQDIRNLLNIAEKADANMALSEETIFKKIEEFNALKTNNIEEKKQVFEDISSLINAQSKLMEDASANISALKKKLSEVRLAPVQPGEQVINLFRNGVREDWVAPSDVVIAVKSMGMTPTPDIIKLLSVPVTALKKGATELNLSFSVPNKFRDVGTAAVTTQSIIGDLAKRYGKNFDVMKMSVDEVKGLYKSSGSYGSSIFKDGDKAVLNELEQVGIVKVIKSGNPIEVIKAINGAIEQSTRENVFYKALGQGLGVKDAIFVSLNATIDFSKMGSSMRDVNKVIPFLNARVQGFVNLGEAFFKNPEAFARAQLYTSIYPTLLLQRHNERFESYKDISQRWKIMGFPIMYNEIEAVDPDTGQKKLIPQFILIPKGEGQILTSSPLQYFLDKGAKIDKRTTNEMLADVLGNVSPVSFQSFNREAPFWSSVISQFGPLATIPTGLATNIEPYTGNKIVPENLKEGSPANQFRNSTPESIKMIANEMNNFFGQNNNPRSPFSPARLEFMLKSFGGMPTDVAKVADYVLAPLTDGDMTLKSITGTPFGEASQQPILGRLLKEDSGFGTTEMAKNQKIVMEETMKSTDMATEKRRNLINIFTALNRKEAPEQKKDYLTSLGSELTPDLLKSLTALKKSKNTFEAITATTDNKVKAGYALRRMTELDTPADKQEFLQSFLEAGLLTKDTLQLMITIKNNPDITDLGKDTNK